MILALRSVACLGLCVSLLDARTAATQQPDSVRQDTAISAPSRSAARSLHISGVLYLNWQYRLDASARGQNRFDLERAYLNFRVPLSNRASIRVTTDVFQNPSASNDSYYRGWSLRAKYAYLQYDFLRGATGVSAWGRLGMLNTVVIEHIESFWPRWLGRTALEQTGGYFSSADLGAAVQLTLPSELGEIYATITNGPGYTSRETDRFKDVAARLTITPFARSDGILSTAALTAWGYKGALASRFAQGGPGQLGPVGESLRRDRWGVFAGLRHRSMTVGADISQAIDEGELGNNTTASPRSVTDSTGTLVSAFAVIRPLEWMPDERRSPIALVARYDRYRYNDDTAPATRHLIAGLIYDLDPRLSLAADFQQTLPRDGASGAPLKTWFIHAVASF
jgi:hypothetical protein